MMKKPDEPVSAEAEARADLNDGRTDPPRDTGDGEGPQCASPEERIQALEQVLAETHEKYLRAQAELQNVLKRHTRELGDRARYAAEGLARDILEVIDDLDRALSHAATGGEDGSAQDLSGVVEGVAMVRQGLLSALERHGISRLEAHGQPFDPGEHDAVMLIESSDHAPNVVVDEHRPGYRIHDRLLRPAMVAVSKAPADGTDDK